jgi:2-dehydropantoate 2-reductase
VPPDAGKEVMQIAVLGAGSLGTIIGALIADHGYDVDLLDASPDHVRALNEKGAVITGHLERTIRVRATLVSEVENTYDLVILLTKQTATEAALGAVMDHLAEGATVCTLQNGVPEEYVASIVGRERTVGGAVGFGATWEGPGQARLTSDWAAVQNYAFDIGELDGSDTTRIREVQRILSSVGHCEVMPDIVGIKWTKLLMNATFSGMSAALGCTFGDVLDDHDAIAALARIADETIKTAHASGIHLVPMQGTDLARLELRAGETVEDKLPLYHQVWDIHRDLKASMLQDLEKRRRTEIGYINGVVSERGAQVGVPTPYNDMVVQLVREAEAAGVVPTFTESLARLRALG